MLKTEFQRLLEAVRINKIYEEAKGDFLYYQEGGRRHRVLDMVGGFGATLFGHNHPVLQDSLREFLNADIPVHAQGSIKPHSRRLAERLARHVSPTQPMRCILANSGAEAVEAAMKHAELARLARLRDIADGIEKNLCRIRQTAADRTLTVHMNGHASRLSARELTDRIHELNESLWRTPPRFLSMKGGFHGKTTGAVQLTHNLEYRKKFTHLGPESRFCASFEDEEIRRCFDDADLLSAHAVPKLRDGGRIDHVDIELKPISRLAAVIAEPIQGEGGIREIPEASLKLLRSLCSERAVPLVFDEIQSGMGRTGRFLACEHAGVSPDYVLLSKSLGGGIVKIGALLIAEDLYVAEFSTIQTSTFAEDELSSYVAGRVLDLIENSTNFFTDISSKGLALKNGILALRDQYPGVIKDVRGRGLMIGIEFHSWVDRPSFLMRFIAQTNRQTVAISGYLLHEHEIRTLQTLSDPLTLRLEPSAYIPVEAIEKFLTALEDVCRTIALENDALLIRHLFDKETDAREPYTSSREKPLHVGLEEVLANVPKVGFIVHFPTYTTMRDHMSGLGHMSTEDCRLFHDRMRKTGEEFWHGVTRNVRLPSGKQVAFLAACMNRTTEQLLEEVTRGDRHQLVQYVDHIIDYFVSQGCQTVGLGMFTSVITKNGHSLVRDDIQITTGNTLTAQLGADAVLKLVHDRHLHLKPLRLAVIGAAGNIAQATLQLLAPHFDEIDLIGSPKTDTPQRLKMIANHLRPRTRDSVPRPWPRRDDQGDRSDELAFVSVVNHNHGERIHLHQNLDELKQADVILSATSSPYPMIFPRHLKENAIVSDISFPMNVDRGVFSARPDVTVIQGGLGTTPSQQHIDMPFTSLKHGQIFACMAETILLGAHRVPGHFSYGDIEMEKARFIRSLFYEEGFKLELDRSWHF